MSVKIEGAILCNVQAGRLAVMVNEYMYLPLIWPQSEAVMQVFDSVLHGNTDHKCRRIGQG